MKVLVAPDKFKGSLTAPAAAAAIARGWAAGWPGCELVEAPIADGGEGFAGVFQGVLGGEWVEQTVLDPLGRPVTGRFVWVEAEKLAVLEMSEASGLWRLQGEELSPLAAHTFGTGQLLQAALERDAQQILVGLGGSATTDGGTGMAAALGYRFLDAHGAVLEPAPRNLARVAHIERPAALRLPEIIGACDVRNPLLGTSGTARIFAPQKGADAATVELLEAGLENLARVAARDLGGELHEVPGAGAAGGFGFGLLTFCGAKLRSGFELVAERLRLAEQMAGCDLVITGEGRLDSQTLDGKGPGGVAQMAHRAGKPVLALAGTVQEGLPPDLYDWAYPGAPPGMPLAQAMAEAGPLLELVAARVAASLRLGELSSTRARPGGAAASALLLST